MSDNLDNGFNELVEREREMNMGSNNIPETEQVENTVGNTVKTERPNILDGWATLAPEQLPRGGILYPVSWKFAYRCPTVKEVARFSAIPDNDTPAMLSAIDDIITKCVKIYDVDKGIQIDSAEINKGDRIFFLEKVRSFYLPNQPIEYDTLCTECHESFKVALAAEKLVFQPIDAKLLEGFDGRIFTITIDGELIKIHIPTIKTYGLIVNHIIKAQRAKQRQQKTKEKTDNVIYDKVFTAISPLLFETGKESINDIIKKFKIVYANDKLLEIYTMLADVMMFDNDESFTEACPHCHSEEEVEVSFPDGINKLFRKHLNF